MGGRKRKRDVKGRREIHNTNNRMVNSSYEKKHRLQVCTKSENLQVEVPGVLGSCGTR